MLKLARVLNPEADLRLSDVEQLPFVAGSFDLVLCLEVLRYLQESSRLIAELARVVRSGGLCILTAAPAFSLNAYSLVNRLVEHVPIGNLVRLRQYFHTSRDLRQAFLASDFCQVEVHGVYLGPINWMERLVPRALPAALRRWEPLDAVMADLPLVREFANMFLVTAVRRD
jgi:ubiquinone/menaquinone biosynthesis C-methylase UbiE